MLGLVAAGANGASGYSSPANFRRYHEVLLNDYGIDTT